MPGAPALWWPLCACCIVLLLLSVICISILFFFFFLIGCIFRFVISRFEFIVRFVLCILRFFFLQLNFRSVVFLVMDSIRINIPLRS